MRSGILAGLLVILVAALSQAHQFDRPKAYDRSPEPAAAPPETQRRRLHYSGVSVGIGIPVWVQCPHDPRVYHLRPFGPYLWIGHWHP